MKSIKKLTAVIGAAVMLTMSALQGTANAAFSDVPDNSPYKSAITTLSTLSIIDGYDDGTFKPDGQITRAEFTKLIVFMLGLQGLSYNTYSFTDVNSSHWAANYIQTAYDRGIIAGFGDGIFAPDDQVTYAQALKMVVCTLGYEDFANGLNLESGGWAEKYIQEGGQLGLSKGIAGSGYYENATRGLVAQVLYNALDIQMYENNGYNWVQTEKTLMKDYIKVRELKGTLVGVEEYVMEDCSYNLLEQQMDIMDSSGEEYLLDYSTYEGGTNALTKLLGSTIKVYYRQPTDKDDRQLISIDSESTKNSVLELNYSDLGGISGNTFKYYDEASKSKTTKLRTDDLTVRYNGKMVGTEETVVLNGVSYTRQQALERWLDPDSDDFIYGNVILTDNSDDGSVDMIQIYDYDIMVAYTKPTTTDYRLTDALVTGNYIILDPQSADYTYTVTKDDAEIALTGINKNDTVLIAKSLDGKLYTLLVSDKTVKGSITSLSSDNTRITISPSSSSSTVASSSVSYDLDYDRCSKYIKEKSNKDIKVGASGTFYLDAFSTVIWGTLEETKTSPYAYIVDAYLDYDEGGKPYITVYAPTSYSTESKSYPLKSSVKLNGSNTKAETAISRIQAAAAYAGDESEFAKDIYGEGKTPSNTEHAQPARVTISGSEVTDIVILSSDELLNQNEDSTQLVKCRELGEYSFSSNSFSQNGKTAFSVNSSTTVIYVPADRRQKKQYARKTISSTFSTGEKYYVEAYDINSSRMAGLVILYGNDGTLTKVKKDTDFSVVVDYPETAYSDVQDDDVSSVKLYTGSSSSVETRLAYNDTEFADVKPGDVIQFAYDSDNLIQGRINNLKIDDVKRVLNEGNTAKDPSLSSKPSEIYNWDVEIQPSISNNFQDHLFDYRFKKEVTDRNGVVSYEDETYTSSSAGTVPNSRAVVFNVSQVLLDENKLYVTQLPFALQEDGTYALDDYDYEEINVTTTTRILRMDESSREDKISKYVADTTTPLTINDIRDARNYGADCSKILVLLSKGNAKMILLYE